MENSELQLKSEMSNVLAAAQSMIVASQQDYENAAYVRKDIKCTLKNISSYWGPKKDQAFQLHKTLVAAEKDMTAPLEQADKYIDQRMGEYRREVERVRIETERERARLEAEARAAAADAQRLIDEASKKDDLDETDAEILMIAQEDVTQKIASYEAATIAPAAASAQGISVRKTWKARIINEALVPVSLVGITIRPVDQSALNKMAALSKGGFECPGVEFYAEESTTVRM